MQAFILWQTVPDSTTCTVYVKQVWYEIVAMFQNRLPHNRNYTVFLAAKECWLSSCLRSKVNKPNLYHETKQRAVEYQTAKECLFKAFLKAGLGAWVEKPIEQDQFSLVV
ncbi:Double-stranded RNA-specific editase 1 [Varanus komodoensis]|nr:Double-stranded RNA-specific editase 1 [Varanus komodoensis]